MRRGGGRLVALAAALAATLVLPACVALPEAGPVVEVEEAGAAATDTCGAAAIDARPPQAGQSATEVVKGFLDAMQAWPTELATAKQYLSSEARASWSPAGTIVYEDALPPSGGGGRVEVRLGGATRLDARGAWQGELAPDDSTLDFALVTEDGEYRIADLPAALVVPETWFEQRYRQVALYFPDPSGSVLVPEPVFVGDDSTFASSLVSGLLRGPGRALEGVVGTQLPSGLRVELSVPVTDGLAAISLTGEAGAFSPADTELLFSQLAWTLRQDPDVDAFTLEIDGRPVRTAAGETRVSVAVGGRLDPVGLQADSLLYGLRDGLRDTVGELRALVHGLRPPVLDQRGLAGAVRALVTGLDEPVCTADVEEVGAPGAAVEVAAYAIARLEFKGKKMVLTTALAIAMFPVVSLVSPLFDLWRTIGLYDTWPGLILPYMSFTLPLAIWTLSAFFREIPWEMEQAAQVDGATSWQAFRKVIVPLAAPGVFTAAILTFFFAWNDFVFGITLTSTEAARPIPAALSFFVGPDPFQRPASLLAAAAVVATIPIVLIVLFFQRKIVAGLTSGAVKG